MTVSLTVSETITGSAFADSLTGGSTGLDYGETETGDTDPPQQDIFLKHDGTFEITNLSVNIKAYTGTYGGDYSASADIAKVLANGDAGSGLQLCLVWNEGTPFTTKTTIKTGTGDNFPDRVRIPVGAFSYNNSGTEVDASAPVEGILGPIGNTIYGDRAHFKMRYLTPSGETAVGRRQYDTYFSYNFTT